MSSSATTGARRRSALVPKLLALAALALAPAAAAAQAPYDVLVHGGRLIDGTGSAAVVRDVAVRAGRIAWIGRPGGAQARDTVDASGRLVKRQR